MDSFASTQRILLVGTHTDPLHSGYLFPIRDGMVEYPSVEHYSYIQTFLQLGLFHKIDNVMRANSENVASTAMTIIKTHMPPGFTIERLQDYLRACRESYTNKGLQLRLQSDKMFEKYLLLTGDSLLIVCDPSDLDMGIGMDEDTFKMWRHNKGIQSQQLFNYIKNPAMCPDLMIGKNKLGVQLMALRDSIRNQKAAALRELRTEVAGGLAVNQQILVLQGIFRPLSNLYSTTIFIRNKMYRSVEHFVQEKMLRKLGMAGPAVHKIRCCVDASALNSLVHKLIQTEVAASRCSESAVRKTYKRAHKWYSRGIQEKFEQFPMLRRLLLGTGNALLFETHPLADEHWAIATHEDELQHIMSKRYMTPKILLNWMLIPEDYPQTLSHLGHNKTGIMLMQLRQTLIEHNTKDCTFVPLIAVPDTACFTATLSAHVLCFSAVSVFSPLYLCAVQVQGVTYRSVEHYVRAQAAQYFAVKKTVFDALYQPEDDGRKEEGEDKEMAVPPLNEISCQWNDVFQGYFPDLDVLFKWEYLECVEAYRRGYTALFEQHPQLQRALLDTGDSLLVYCTRYMTASAEWSVGMRECELRAWMHTCRVSSSQLAFLCALPLAHRPSMLGGNRIGSLLVEIRRELVSSGALAHNLPEMDKTGEQILGSDSVTEAMQPFEWYDTDTYDYNASLWSNPLLIAVRRLDDETEWNRAVTRPLSAEQQKEEAEKAAKAHALDPHADLQIMDEFQQRNLLMHIVMRLRHMMTAKRLQHQKIEHLQQETSKMRTLKENMRILLEGARRADQVESEAAERTARAVQAAAALSPEPDQPSHSQPQAPAQSSSPPQTHALDDTMGDDDGGAVCWSAANDQMPSQTSVSILGQVPASGSQLQSESETNMEAVGVVPSLGDPPLTVETKATGSFRFDSPSQVLSLPARTVPSHLSQSERSGSAPPRGQL